MFSPFPMFDILPNVVLLRYFNRSLFDWFLATIPPKLILNICNIFSINFVDFQASQPYSKMDLPLMLKFVIMNFREICFDFHVELSCVKPLIYFQLKYKRK